MKKGLFTLLLTLVFTLSIALTAFASVDFKNRLTIGLNNMFGINTLTNTMSFSDMDIIIDSQIGGLTVTNPQDLRDSAEYLKSVAERLLVKADYADFHIAITALNNSGTTYNDGAQYVKVIPNEAGVDYVVYYVGSEPLGASIAGWTQTAGSTSVYEYTKGTATIKVNSCAVALLIFDADAADVSVDYRGAGRDLFTDAVSTQWGSYRIALADVGTDESIIVATAIGGSGTAYVDITPAPPFLSDVYNVKIGVEYTVTFDVDGGAPTPAQQIVKKGDTATEPTTAPTKTNTTFMCWLLNGVKYDFSNPVTADITLVAQYGYKITFDPNGGTLNDVSSVVVLPGSKLTEPTPPTRLDYDFVGWWDANYLLVSWGQWIFDPVTGLSNHQVNSENVLQAQWTPNTALVRAELQALVDNLYAWWWIHGTYPGATINLNDYPNITNELPYYPHPVGYSDPTAVFKYRQYVDDMANARNDAIDLLADATATKAALEAALDDLQDAYDALKAAILVYLAELSDLAAFNAEMMAISNSGSGYDDSKQYVQVRQNSAGVDYELYYVGTDPTNALFSGWTKTGTGDYSDPYVYKKGNAEVKVITLAVALLVFDADPAYVNVNFRGNDLFLPTTATLWNGKYIALADVGSDSSIINATPGANGGVPIVEITPALTAIGFESEPYEVEISVWYTVTFNSNGGSSVPPQIVKQYGYATQPANPQKNDYVFYDWYYYSPGYETPYQFGVHVVNSDIELTARWAFTITFDPNNGVDSTFTVNFLPGTMVDEPAVPTHPAGLTFDAWYDDIWYPAEFAKMSFPRTFGWNNTLTAYWN